MSKDAVRSLIEKKFNELQEFAKLYNTQAQEQRAKLLNEYRDAFKKDPKSIDIVSIAKDMFYLNGFYQADIRKMQVQLLEQYTMTKEIYPEMTFNEDIETTIGILKSSLPKQIFVVKDGKFQEIEKGKVEELTADFETKGYYKLFEEQITKILHA